jgi:hypothetical protein
MCVIDPLKESESNQQPHGVVAELISERLRIIPLVSNETDEFIDVQSGEFGPNGGVIGPNCRISIVDDHLAGRIHEELCFERLDRPISPSKIARVRSLSSEERRVDGRVAGPNEQAR